MHRAAFFVTIPAGAVLAALARGAVATAAVVVYALGFAGLYGTSAAFHLGDWGPRARAWMRRADHSMIYVAIAGSYTAVGLLVLHGPARMLVPIVWAGAGAGVALKLTGWRRGPVLGAVLYVVLGWVAVLALPQLVRGLSPAGVALLVAGGVLYTSGAVVLWRRRPDPIPAVFGYHEVWHSMVVGASACHYAVVLLALRAAR